jgi:uncharacterized membrane protein
MITPLIILAMLCGPLVIAWILFRIQGKKIRTTEAVAWGLASAFFFFFIGHMIKSEGMIAMLPPWMPQRAVLVFLSGVLEFFIAIALIVPQSREHAVRIALCILVAFFPINIYAAWNYVGLGGHQWGPVYLFIRAPLQIILIAWSLWLLRIVRSETPG